MVFHILQGIGIAAAVGIRPFLPALLVGALAAGNVQISFKATDYHFLQSAPFLLALVVLTALLALAERRIPQERLERREGLVVLGAAGAALGALLFGADVSRGHHAAWPGFVGGVICAGIGLAATRPLFARVRQRLDASTAAALPLYGEATGLLVALLSVLAPPVGPVALALLAWLAFAGRRRGAQKYAGLRILR